eukprot:3092608-Amphidinium_carterae.1
MSEISQKIKSVIRFVICVTTMRNQRQVKMSLKEKSARKFKGTQQSRHQRNRLNVKDFLPQKFKGDRGQFKAWANEVMLFLNNEEPRLTGILKQLQTIRQPITDANVISGYNVETESERFTSLSKVILHRLLSMTEAWRQLNIQYYGGSVARQYTNLKLILSPTWGNYSSAGEMLKHSISCQLSQGTTQKNLLLNMNESTSFDDIKKTFADLFQSTYVIQQTHSG